MSSSSGSTAFNLEISGHLPVFSLSYDRGTMPSGHNGIGKGPFPIPLRLQISKAILSNLLKSPKTGIPYIIVTM